jgi:hypothetical protein
MKKYKYKYLKNRVLNIKSKKSKYMGLPFRVTGINV